MPSYLVELIDMKYINTKLKEYPFTSTGIDSNNYLLLLLLIIDLLSDIIFNYLDRLRTFRIAGQNEWSKLPYDFRPTITPNFKSKLHLFTGRGLNVLIIII